MTTPAGTEILAPSGAASGTLLAPGHGSLLPHGIVWPHQLPKPEDFHLPQIAVPTVSGALVPSFLTGSPPASGGAPKLTDVQLPQPSVPGVPGTKIVRARELYAGARARSRRAIGALPEFVRRPVSKLGENTGKSKLTSFGMRWG